ncbi:2-keto-4-pentenoate hydratase, partial [Acinetobacter baumannii]
RNARAGGSAIVQISVSHGVQGLDQAYAVAELNTRQRIADGARVIGKKVGLTSVAVQKQLGVDQPDFGVLFDDMEYLSGDSVPMNRLIQPKAEAEVAFVVARDLPA